jgi:hypothetical protein
MWQVYTRPTSASDFLIGVLKENFVLQNLKIFGIPSMQISTQNESFAKRIP